MKSICLGLFVFATTFAFAGETSKQVSIGNIMSGSEFVFHSDVDASTALLWKDSKYCLFELGSNYKNKSDFSFFSGQVVRIKYVEEKEVQTAYGPYIVNVFVFSGSKYQTIFSYEARLSANVTIDVPYSLSNTPLLSSDYVGMNCITKSEDLISVEELLTQGTQLGFSIRLK